MALNPKPLSPKHYLGFRVEGQGASALVTGLIIAIIGVTTWLIGVVVMLTKLS